ncbi:MAG: sodium:alanine symporter family protein, partial [Oscillibacter sp.]
MEILTRIVSTVNDVLWDKQLLLLFLLLGTGVYFTIGTRFVQIRKFGEGWRRLFGGYSLRGANAGKECMSSFQAQTTA